MKKNLKLLLLSAMTMAVLSACTDNLDIPVNPVPVNPETPEQQAFWARFDAWQTDSCTLGDDFYMHMIGTWWKKPVDIYPDGVTQYGTKLNDERVNAIKSSEPNLVKLMSHINDQLTMNGDEVEQMINAKVEELWAGATTRDEALAALGRAWAQGYTIRVEPSINIIDGVPTWLVQLKWPSYVYDSQVPMSKEELWRALAQRKIARMKTRAEQQTASDLDKIIKGMNIGLDHIEMDDKATKALQDVMANEWSTIDGIWDEINGAVSLLDGALVNDDYLAYYNLFVNDILGLNEQSKQVVLNRKKINYYVMHFMGSPYILNYYNQQYITPATRERYTKWCEMFRDAMRQRLETNTWLEDVTRQKALDKLEKIVFCVGSINDLPDCTMPTLTGSTIIDDVRQLRKARLDAYCWASTKKREEVVNLLEILNYQLDFTKDNAWYGSDLNIVEINPSNLCSPYVEDDYEDALQWAFLASTIGHEITHAFDKDGRMYDLWGHKSDWWTAADVAKFNTLCDQLTDRYNQLQLMPWIDPTLYCDGKTTLGENTADLGGCCLGLQILLSEHPNATDEEKAALMRRFFQAWAIQWSDSYDLKHVESFNGLSHPLHRERTNGVVRNMDEWYDAYGIKSGSLYLQPADRVRIW